jgi:hypothetical protein
MAAVRRVQPDQRIHNCPSEVTAKEPGVFAAHAADRGARAGSS